VDNNIQLYCAYGMGALYPNIYWKAFPVEWKQLKMAKKFFFNKILRRLYKCAKIDATVLRLF